MNIKVKIIKSQQSPDLESKINKFCEEKAISKNKLIDIKYYGDSCMIIYSVS